MDGWMDGRTDGCCTLFPSIIRVQLHAGAVWNSRNM